MTPSLPHDPQDLITGDKVRGIDRPSVRENDR